MGKGQVSIEYMLVLAFMFVLLVPLLILFSNTQKDTSDTLVEGQLQNVGTIIRNTAERLYFAGAPAQEELEIYLPAGVKNVSLTNTSLVFLVAGGTGQYELLVPTIAPLNGTFLLNKGSHTLTLTAQDGYVQVTE